ncbi:MAG TPA: zf-HC2 domain-containing protein [Micromonosporaceae bacterium]|nr:zf-HC2 domain-containing protein [Micromonosporaceae bacterium]
MTCPMLVESGVYVLGALSPAQRQAYERHLSTCAECRAEVGELAVLPGLMGRLDDASFEREEVGPAPSAIVPAVVTRLRKRRRNRRLIAIGGAVAAASLALVVGLVTPNQPSQPRPVAGQSTSAVATRAMTQVGNIHIATASLGLSAFTGGTHIVGSCTYATSGNRYEGSVSFRLIVYPKDGQPEQVGSWSALPGQTVPINASTWWPMTDLSHIDLVGPDGSALLTYAVA